MSTTVDARQDRGTAGPAPAPTRGIPFGRLVGVELRKLVDTRSGRWLLIVIAGLAIIVLAAIAFAAPDNGMEWLGYVNAGVIPVAMLLPVLGILTMTSEWSQRTAMVTFALEPRRGRVLLAKVLATLLWTVAVLVVVALAAALAAAVAGALASHPSHPWTFDGAALGRILADVAVAVLMGLAFGLLLGVTPLAIVLYYVLPLVMQPLTMWDKTSKIAEWIDPGAITAPLRERFPGMPEAPWSHAATAALVWIVLPLVVGTWRWLRREAK